MDTNYINRRVKCLSRQPVGGEKNKTKQQNPVPIVLYKPDAGLCGNQTPMLILLILFAAAQSMAGNCELLKDSGSPKRADEFLF